MNQVDFFAQQPHYFDHLVPLWDKIPEQYKNKFYVSGNYVKEFGLDLQEYCENKGYEVEPVYNILETKNPIVAGGLAQTFLKNKSIILINHGAGQSYIPHGSHSYAGGKGREGVLLFIQPNYHAANSDKQRYPKSEQAIVGCCKLDEWHQKTLNNKIKTRGQKPVIAISFHFDCAVCPETRSTFEYYKSQLAMLAHKNMAKEWVILGHGHPGIINILEPYYKEYGIEVVHEFEEVMERADLYIMDHMSTLYEFASTGRPVVVLNAPWYRKDVEHGLRFWECADVGINVDYPNKLEQAIHKALADPLEQKMKRERALTKVYAYRDGMATDRAVEAIVKFLETNEYKTEDMRKKRSSQGLSKEVQKKRWFA